MSRTASTRNWRKRVYNERRAFLILKLGGYCVKCGSDQGLEFHHIDPLTRTWTARWLDRETRMKHYMEDEDKGLLQLLCQNCHEDSPGYGIWKGRNGKTIKS